MMKPKVLRRFLAIALSVFPSAAFADCNFPTAQRLSELQNPGLIKQIRIEVPKSAKFNRNFAKIITSKSENIPPKLKKKFKAHVFVEYGFGVCSYKASVKQNGDWKDHVEFADGLPLRSLNVKLKEGNILNAVKFKLLIPKTRNGLNEILGTLVARELGFIAPETFEVSVDVNGTVSKMLFQEDARKELLERNLRREGPMFEGDEELLWSYPGKDNFELEDISLARLINPKWFLKGASSQHITLQSFAQIQRTYVDYANARTRTLTVMLPNNGLSREFEDYYFLMWTLNGVHALRPHNRRFYYNSFTGRLEPIYYDGDLSALETIDLNYNWYSAELAFSEGYVFPFTENLKSPGFGTALRQKFKMRVRHFDAETQRILEVILRRLHANAVSLQEKVDKRAKQWKLVDSRVPANEAYVARARKHSVDQKYLASIEPQSGGFTAKLDDGSSIDLSVAVVSRILARNEMDGERYVFLPQRSGGKAGQDTDISEREVASFQGGLVHSSGIQLDIDETKKEMRITQSAPTDWILVRNADLSGWNVKFTGLDQNEDAAPDGQRFNFHGMTGCLNFYNSIFDRTSVSAVGGQCEDGVNIVSSRGSLDILKVERSYADAVDMDFSDLRINRVEVREAGNDCLDVSGGTYKIGQASLARCVDKGISVGEGSTFDIEDVSVQSAHLGLSVKDFSTLRVGKGTVSNAVVCVEAMQKKQEFGGAMAMLEDMACDGQFLQDRNSIIHRGPQ